MKNKKDIIKLIFIIVGLIIIIGIGIYMSRSLWEQSSCNCLLYNISNEEANQTMGTYTNMTADEVKAALDSDSSIILLDVRTEAEYNQGHIPNSILIPVDNLKNKAFSELPDKNAKIIVYCRSGARSATACNILVNLGYTNVYNMLGGIMGWRYKTE